MGQAPSQIWNEQTLLPRDVRTASASRRKKRAWSVRRLRREITLKLVLGAPIRDRSRRPATRWQCAGMKSRPIAHALAIDNRELSSEQARQ
jgi:hypothetical protein